MKPKPFSELNHLTVPVAMTVSLTSNLSLPTPAGQRPGNLPFPKHTGKGREHKVRDVWFALFFVKGIRCAALGRSRRGASPYAATGTRAGILLGEWNRGTVLKIVMYAFWAVFVVVA